jgi:ribulose-phosphate 3-epimerase
VPPSPLLIAPSILSADFGRLQDDIDAIEKAGADWIQIDVMDGHFVKNLSFGVPVVQWIKTRLPLDIHFMVTNPAERTADFFTLNDKGLTIGNVTFHAEAVMDTAARRALIAQIRAGGATAGIALRPGTPVSAIDDIINDIDLVLVMTVEPGFGGQAFRPEALEKVRTLRAAHPDLLIQVDGGINAETAPLSRKAGANVLVAGSFLVRATDKAAAMATLRA